MWLSGYSFRKKITITGQSGAGTNYQIKLLIGDAAGGDFHLEGNALNFPNDIRFTDNDGETELKYYIEETGNDPIVVWVKVADSLESGTVDIYVYYGKSGDTTTLNGLETFVFFEDFEDAAVKFDQGAMNLIRNNADSIQGSYCGEANNGSVGHRQKYDNNNSFNIRILNKLPMDIC